MAKLEAALGAANWLVWQATYGYWAFAPILAVSIACLFFLRRQPRIWLVLLLPLIWLIPPAVAGLAWDRASAEAKTADWVGWVALGSLAAMTAAAACLITTLRGARLAAALAVLANAPAALMSALVVAMASSGDWI